MGEYELIFYGKLLFYTLFYGFAHFFFFSLVFSLLVYRYHCWWAITLYLTVLFTSIQFKCFHHEMWTSFKFLFFLFCCCSSINGQYVVNLCVWNVECGLFRVTFSMHFDTFNGFCFIWYSITLMYSLRLQVPVLQLKYRRQSNPWLPVRLSVAVEKIAVFALAIVATLKSFEFALVAVVVNYPTLRASFVHSLWQLELIRGPKHGYCNPWAHSIGSCLALVQTAMMSVCLYEIKV